MEESPYLKAHESIRRKFDQLPLIGSLCEADQLAILHASRVRRFAAGEVITREGEYDHWVYILIQGQVEVAKSGQMLAQLREPGETFGELSMVDHKPRSATVTASSKTLCLAIDTTLMGEIDPLHRDAFYALMYRMFAELLAARLRDSNEEMVALKRELEQLKQESASHRATETRPQQRPD